MNRKKLEIIDIPIKNKPHVSKTVRDNLSDMFTSCTFNDNSKISRV